MLPLVCVLGSSVLIICFTRKRSSGTTYRCPCCAQIAVGEYHRRKCLPQSGHENIAPEQRKQESRHAVTARLPHLRVRPAYPGSGPS